MGPAIPADWYQLGVMWRRLLAIASVLVVAFCLLHPPDTSPSESLLNFINAIEKRSQKSINGVSERSHLPTKEDAQNTAQKTNIPDKEIPERIRKKRQSYQDYLDNLGRADYDVRIEEGWQDILYPFGTWAMDEQLMGQAGRETQTNLGFDCPFFGFRFNYTFVYPMGMISFAQPSFTTPPWTFPNPSWPKQRDHSFIAPFYADAMYQWIGNTKISNTFYRSVHRPRSSIYGQQNIYQQQQYRKKRQMPGRISQPGMVVDPLLLDNITQAVRDGYTGANGWRAEHAFIVTWYRMAYGGAPRALDVSQFEHVKDWQNTFQLVVATDEIRTFAIFNYARLNWTTSNEAGGLNGFGGKQAAVAGFNGGNGTGWYQLPYSGHGRIWKLAYFSNVLTPGRWIHRIDEVIIPAGCTNASTGRVITAPPWGPMQGGMAVNISGPCLRPTDNIKVNFENWQVDCKRLNRVRARCIMPMFHKTGLVSIRMSRDGGQSFPFFGKFYVVVPDRAPAYVSLKDDVDDVNNRWYQPYAESLTMSWQALNLTYNFGARVDISLFGYWEDADRSHFVQVDYLAKGVTNTGTYSFKPSTLQRQPLIQNAWQKFTFGFVRVSLSDAEDGVLWSKPTPFPWYYLPDWKKHYGTNWALDMCIEWFEYDGKRRNFQMDLTKDTPCPCKMSQALLDLGRYMPIMDCDKDGDTSCPVNKGAQHCIQGVQPSSTGSSQQCCYDYDGYLMFTDDWEPDGDYNRFYQPGTPARAHKFGASPFRQPPFIPTMSNYQLDLMPYRTCCTYAQHCEFYYWRRMTNGCQDYKAPAAGYMYGEPHVITFDGAKYTFPGKGYFVLVMSDDPTHKLMVQVRLEQPDDTLWHSHVNATVITGVAVQENDSSIVQVFARKPMRRWRYRTDVYVDGVRRFFDKPHWKYQQFRNVDLRNPLQNMNQSEIIIMLKSGVGIQVHESYGMLDVLVSLPPSYNTTCKPGVTASSSLNSMDGTTRCYTTLGLLGTYNNDINDDLTSSTGQVTRSSGDTFTASTTQMIYDQFGSTWRVDGKNDKIGSVLFSEQFKPIYNPLLFASTDYTPVFWPQYLDMNASRVFTMEQVTSTCQGVPQCEYDYTMTGRREVGLTTLRKQKNFFAMQKSGSKQLISCGPLLKKEGVVKTPANGNYLDGDSVTFSCKPKYFIHGDIERTCRNGTWSPGWWAWCRDRNLEYALKWMTALLSIFGIVMVFIIFFCILWNIRRKKQQEHAQRLLEKGGITDSRLIANANTRERLSKQRLSLM
ncbi:AMOP domain protein [Trichostrongylus colubriformis]|uniref:AMOP domain protein n=1 Tax=Trichostrongylus colubriformis TaxID=6319 RepID=A0AAN8FHM6_TRICO